MKYVLRITGDALEHDLLILAVVYMTNTLRFTLYIAGQSPPSIAARENLTRLCAAVAHTVCEITVIDVFAEPEQAESARILATPTLIKHFPLPERRIIGDLTDFDKVLRALGLENYALILAASPSQNSYKQEE
ncbi:MAG: hypothetical protein OHK0052_01770 [Anaerolineales bacterium]